jgi:hypothetical protein
MHVCCIHTHCIFTKFTCQVNLVLLYCQFTAYCTLYTETVEAMSQTSNYYNFLEGRAEHSMAREAATPAEDATGDTEQEEHQDGMQFMAEEGASAEQEDMNGSNGTVGPMRKGVFGHIVDVSMKASKKRKEDSSITHFRFFLKLHYPEQYVVLEDLAYEDINQELMGAFATYLAGRARKYLKDANDPISLGSATGYMSSLKSYFCNRFREYPTPTVFEKEHWKRLIQNITNMKADYARANNKRLVEPHEKADDTDRIALGAVCVWNCSFEAAMFHHLMNSMVSCVGR